MSDPTTLPIGGIAIPENVRVLDDEHVDRLKGSIQLQGVLVPLIVKPTADGYELVAGFHRLRAATDAGLKEVPVVVRDSNGSTDTERAVENIVRKELTPHEEAVALSRALDSGLTEKGAAQALGWSAKRVTERRRILELPEDAQSMVGGTFRAECVEKLIEFHAKAPKLWDRLLDSVRGDADDELDRVSLSKLEDWAHNVAWRDGLSVECWAAHGAHVEDDLPKMKPKLRDRWRALKDTEYGYEREFRFTLTDQDRDNAHAMGVYIDLGSRAIVCDKDFMLLAAEAAVLRAEQDREAEREAKKKSKETVAFEATPKDPQKVLQSLERRDVRETTPAARQANEDLANAMTASLSSVELTKDVAVFFSRQALGHLWTGGTSFGNPPLTEYLARRLALCVPELRKTIDQGTTKSGKPKPVKVEYADGNEAAVWLRKWVEQPKEPKEILGRTMVVFAIAQEVDMEVVPVSQQAKMLRNGLSLPTDAEKALTRIAKPHIPASVKGIRREKSKRSKARTDAYQEAIASRREEQTPPASEDEEVEA